EGAPQGSVHCSSPPARYEPPPIPDITEARPLSPWAVASQTVRKHRTCLASPQATARQASTTDPSWAGSSRPPVYQLSSSLRASCTSVTPAPENPGGVSMFPG